jgi:hypothetical protein
MSLYLYLLLFFVQLHVNWSNKIKVAYSHPVVPDSSQWLKTRLILQSNEVENCLTSGNDKRCASAVCQRIVFCDSAKGGTSQKWK